MAGIGGSSFRAPGFGLSEKSLGRVTWAIACLISAGVCLGQPSEEALRTYDEELEAKFAGKPYATPTDPLVHAKVVRGTLQTPGPQSELFRFTVAAGAMLYVTNTLTGEEFSYVVSPNVAENSEGIAVKQPENSDSGSDVAIRAFRITDENELVETEFWAISTERRESFPDTRGSNCIINVKSIEPRRPGGVVNTGATCCVSCGTYQVCGTTVTSSCGSCSANGPGRENKDVPRPTG